MQHAPPNWPIPVTRVTGRECLEHYQAWSAEAFVTADIDFLLAHRSQFIDQLLEILWQQCGLSTNQISLIAVGGFGRGSLHPQSDIDLLFLHEQPLTSAAEQAIAHMIQTLWDLRLDVGHSVRTPAQCIEQAQADVTVATSLLEQRYICGDQTLAEQFLWQTQRDFPWTSRAFFQAKYDEQQQRHQRYHGTSYNLEPNVKSSPGGL